MEEGKEVASIMLGSWILSAIWFGGFPHLGQTRDGPQPSVQGRKVVTGGDM